MAEELLWHSKDGLDIFAVEWPVSLAPRAVICLVHGIGEHVGRYEYVSSVLNSAGFVVLGADLRGHGRSGGARGHTPDYDLLMDDISNLLSQAASRYPGVPQLLYGHSLGGNLVINFVLRRGQGLKGAIVTSPWLKLAFEPSSFQVGLARIMNKIAPGFSQANNLDLQALSRDKSVAEAYLADPLVHNLISARLFTSAYQNGLWALENANKLSIPMLLMHGTADRLTSCEASRQFSARAGEMVKFVAWEGFYHETHNEPEKAEVVATTVDWLNHLGLS